MYACTQRCNEVGAIPRAQNRRQKVVNKWPLRLCGGGFTFVQGRLDIKNWQKFHWFIVLQISNLWGLELCLGGAKPTKAPPWRRDCPGAEKSQCHKYFKSIFAFEKPQGRTWGRQTCFLPRAPSYLVTPLRAPNPFVNAPLRRDSTKS